MTKNNIQRWLLFIGCLVSFILLPFVLPEFKLHQVTEILIFILFAISFNLLFGYGGMLPFGHAAYFGVGAYATALSFIHLPELPLLMVFLLAVVISCVAGIIIGSICVRFKSTYFALITFAFQMFLFSLALKLRSVTGGDDGMSFTRPDLHIGPLSIPLIEASNNYYMIFVIVALAVGLCYLFLKTPLGNSIMCVRENELRASSLGYNVYLIRLTVNCFAAMLAGLAGSLFASYQEFVAASSIDMSIGMTVIFMVVLGGKGHYLGPALGAAIYMIFHEWITSITHYGNLFMGILFVLVILFLEDGAVSLLAYLKPGRWLNRGRT